MLTDVHEGARKSVITDILHLYDMGGEGFLLKIDVEVET
jgi:hypothetical protein